LLTVISILLSRRRQVFVAGVERKATLYVVLISRHCGGVVSESPTNRTLTLHELRALFRCPLVSRCLILRQQN
jgi:hypothetical protein